MALYHVMIPAITGESLQVSERLSDRPHSQQSAPYLPCPSVLFFPCLIRILSNRQRPAADRYFQVSVVVAVGFWEPLPPNKRPPAHHCRQTKAKHTASLWALLMNKIALRGLASVAPSQLIATAPSQLIAIYPLLQALDIEASV